jgi:hypothetical protein
MGEAKRRQAERTAALAEARAIGERLLAVSTEAREEIAREVAGVAFAWGAGTCALRNVHAQGVIGRGSGSRSRS